MPRTSACKFTMCLAFLFALLIKVVILLAKTNYRIKLTDIEKWVESQMLKLKGGNKRKGGAAKNNLAIKLINCNIAETQVQIPSLVFSFCLIMIVLLWPWALQEAHILISSTGTVLICLNKFMILDNIGWRDPALWWKVLVMMCKSFIMNFKSKLVHDWLGFLSW